MEGDQSANRESFIQDGQVDIVVATYTINDDRKQQVALRRAVLHRRPGHHGETGNPMKIKGPEDLASKKVCSVEGRRRARTSMRVPQGPVGPVRRLLQVRRRAGQRPGGCGHDGQRHPHGLVAGSPDKFKLVGKPFTEEPYGIGLKKEDTDFRSSSTTCSSRPRTGTWPILGRTAGKITGQKAPEPPQVDRY